jgi:hypothetical protein
MADLVKRIFHAPPTDAQLRELQELVRVRQVKLGIRQVNLQLAVRLAKERCKEQPVQLVEATPVEEQPLPLVEAAPIAMRPAGYEAPGGIAIYITAGVAGGFMAAIYGWPWTLAAYGLAGLTGLVCIGRATA